MCRHSVGHLFLALFSGLIMAAVLIILISSVAIEVQANLSDSSSNFNSSLDSSIPPEYLPLAQPDYPSNYTQNSSSSLLCLEVHTGTVTSRYIISNPGGVSGFNDYNMVNFSQHLYNQTPTTIEIEITTHRYLDTQAPYPVNMGGLPIGVQHDLLPEPGWIQSDNPLIAAKARELVSSATRQAEAVEAIAAWVRGNIRWEGGHPSDALSVFNNRAGVCAGFSTLTTALLRAAGIPAQYHAGCVSKWGDGWGWVVGDAGGWHAWNELYYPDVGWVALDPQVSTNYLDAGHILAGFDQCGEQGTVISRTFNQSEYGYLYAFRTTYTDPPWPNLWVANIPAWDRHPLQIPDSPGLLLPITNPYGTLALRVENLSCGEENWQIRTAASWLTPTIITGTTAGIAQFTVDASGMLTGFYTSPMTIYATSSPWWWQTAISRTVTVKLWLVDNVYQVYLPITDRK